jgi:hypothetical protein
MATLVRNGQYLVGEVTDTPRRDPSKKVGVIRGDVANESRDSGFQRVMGLQSSKWYLYEVEEYIRQYDDRSGTGVLIVATIKDSFSSKGDAADEAERLYNLD